MDDDEKIIDDLPEADDHEDDPQVEVIPEPPKQRTFRGGGHNATRFSKP